MNGTNTPAAGTVLPDGAMAILHTALPAGTPVYTAPVAAGPTSWPACNNWAQAVDEARVAVGLDCTTPTDDPAKALGQLVQVATAIALDPAVSQQARALVERGGRTPAAPAARDLVARLRIAADEAGQVGATVQVLLLEAAEAMDALLWGAP